jgi:hypothetical protein
MTKHEEVKQKHTGRSTQRICEAPEAGKGVLAVYCLIFFAFKISYVSSIMPCIEYMRKKEEGKFGLVLRPFGSLASWV